MLETILCIILAPVALAAVGFTVCLAIGLVKGIMKTVNTKI